MRTHGALLLAALAAASVGCKASRPVGAPHESERAFLFPHDKHDSVECLDCHTNIAKSSALGQAGRLPERAKCEECHPDLAKPTDEPTRKAAEAWADIAKRPAAQDYQITFNHEDHLAQIAGKDVSKSCASCHKVLPQAGLRADVTPPMDACTACHHHKQEVAEARCQPCHVSLRRFPLKPIEAIAGMSHTAQWVREHGKVAKNTADTCATCHDQTYCSNCHATATVPFRPEIRWPERVEANFIHRGDYVSRHQIEVQADPAYCRKCHGSFFCDSCHTAQNVSPRVRLGVAGAGPNNPHPPNWANNIGAGPQLFHGDAARANIVSCAGCHDQGSRSICTTCHVSRGPGQAGVGGNPHPFDFRSQHKRGEIGKTPMCRACHLGG